MDTYTYVYSHTFHFEKAEFADSFRAKFAQWINKGKE